MSLAAAAHQGWSANIFTTASDMYPKQAVASVVGFGGMAGAVGGMIVAKVVGYVLEWTGSYVLRLRIAAGRPTSSRCWSSTCWPRASNPPSL